MYTIKDKYGTVIFTSNIPAGINLADVRVEPEVIHVPILVEVNKIRESSMVVNDDDDDDEDNNNQISSINKEKKLIFNPFLISNIDLNAIFQHIDGYKIVGIKYKDLIVESDYPHYVTDIKYSLTDGSREDLLFIRIAGNSNRKYTHVTFEFSKERQCVVVTVMSGEQEERLENALKADGLNNNVVWYIPFTEKKLFNFELVLHKSVPPLTQLVSLEKMLAHKGIYAKEILVDIFQRNIVQGKKKFLAQMYPENTNTSECSVCKKVKYEESPS